MCNHVHVKRGPCLLEYNHEEGHYYREDALTDRKEALHLRQKVEELEEQKRGFEHIIEGSRKYALAMEDELRYRAGDIAFLQGKVNSLEAQLRQDADNFAVKCEMSRKGPSR